MSCLRAFAFLIYLLLCIVSSRPKQKGSDSEAPRGASENGYSLAAEHTASNHLTIPVVQRFAPHSARTLATIVVLVALPVHLILLLIANQSTADCTCGSPYDGAFDTTSGTTDCRAGSSTENSVLLPERRSATAQQDDAQTEQTETTH